jgi:hypothetical protein
MKSGYSQDFGKSRFLYETSNFIGKKIFREPKKLFEGFLLREAF